MFGKLFNRKLTWIAEIDGTGDAVGAFHQADQAFDQVVDIAEASCLLAVAIKCYVFALERLNDEVRYDAAIIWVHTRPIRVEDARHLDVEIVLAMIIKEERSSTAFALVLTGPRTDRVDITPIAFFLRVHCRVAINFRGRGLQDARLHALGEAQHIDRAVDAGLRRLNRVELIMDRTGWAGHVVDLIDFDEEWKGHIVTKKFERLRIEQVRDVRS